jgi:hypothetical protein
MRSVLGHAGLAATVIPFHKVYRVALLVVEPYAGVGATLVHTGAAFQYNTHIYQDEIHGSILEQVGKAIELISYCARVFLYDSLLDLEFAFLLGFYYIP